MEENKEKQRYHNLDHPLRKLRKTIGKTQQELAEALGCHFRQIQKIEQGEAKSISETFLRELTLYCGVNAEDIAKPTGEPRANFSNRPYTENDWKKWSQPWDFSKKQIQSIIEEKSELLTAIVTISAARGRYQIFDYLFKKLVQECLDRNVIGPEMMQGELEVFNKEEICDAAELDEAPKDEKGIPIFDKAPTRKQVREIKWHPIVEYTGEDKKDRKIVGFEKLNAPKGDSW